VYLVALHIYSITSFISALSVMMIVTSYESAVTDIYTFVSPKVKS
jgi:hypothetical protein